MPKTLSAFMNNTRVRKILLIVAIFMALAVLAILVNALLVKQGIKQSTNQSISTQQPKLKANFSLMDETGAHVTEQNFAGQYRLVYFGFSFCPDVCPMQLQVIGEALDIVEDILRDKKNEVEKITTLFISLDAARDTPEVLTKYTDLFNPMIIGLTGTKEQIKQAAQAFKVYYALVEDKESEAGYTVDHSSIVYLLGPDNEFLKAYTHRDTAENIAQDLAQQLTAR